MNGLSKRGRLLLAILMVFAIALPGAATAQDDPNVENSEERTETENTDSSEQATARFPAASFSQLVGKAEREETVRVIVSLQADFAPEGRLSSAQRTDQRNTIESAQSRLRTNLDGTGFQTLRQYDTIPAIALEVSPRALEALQNSPLVTNVVEDQSRSLIQTENTGMSLAESTAIVQAHAIWDYGLTGSGQVVAVLDSGVDSSHRFLSGRVIEEACFAGDNGDGRTGSGDCPNGNRTQYGPGSAAPCEYARIGCEHGTHVAGIAAGQDFFAEGRNSGVAKGADIMAVQVVSERTGGKCNNDVSNEDPCPGIYDSDLLAGLAYVYGSRYDHDIASVNISIGGGRDIDHCDSELPAFKEAIDNLKSAGIATVVASGNAGYTDAMEAPACISSAVSVGSTTEADELSDFSNSASFLSLLAPGSGIGSSVPEGGFAAKSGTSMAAPHVAGAWALLKHRYPSASVDSILSALQSTGTPVPDTRPGGGITKPRINIADALAPDPGYTTRVSVGRSGNEGNFNSFDPSISSDGRFVAFTSVAENLVPGDTGAADIFVRDRQEGTIERVSVSRSGNQANGFSGGTSISADGRFVAFTSSASNLVSGDTNGDADIFVYDRRDGATERVSVDSSGNQKNGTGSIIFGGGVSISADGRFVAFASIANNLVSGDTNGTYDVFVRDRDTDEDDIFDEAGAVSTERVSVASSDNDGSSNEGNDSSGKFGTLSLSADGRFVAFEAAASNLTPNDTNGTRDVFVRDRQEEITERISVDNSGNQADGFSGDPSMSSDGRFVAFDSTADNLVSGDNNDSEDIFVRDRREGTTERMSAARGRDPSISADGSFVAYFSSADNLVSGDTNGADDVFVRDRQAGTTERVSVNSPGYQADGGGHSPSINGDGYFVAFESRADNLVEGDTNGVSDIFVRDRRERISGYPPVADDKTVETDEDTARVVTLSGSHAYGDDLVFRITDQPEHGTVGDVGLSSCTGTSPRTCSAEVTYTPDDNYTGSDSFAYEAYKVSHGSGGTDPATVTITVEATDPPNAKNDSYKARMNKTLKVRSPGILKNDSDPQGDSLTAELARRPRHGNLTLRKDGSFVFKSRRSDSFTYRACDNGACSGSATVKISIKKKRRR